MLRLVQRLPGEITTLRNGVGWTWAAWYPTVADEPWIRAARDDLASEAPPTEMEALLDGDWS